jgi:hypothetical protein
VSQSETVLGEDVTKARPECQIDWYDKRSGTNQHRYKTLKVVVIVIAASIPLLSGIQLTFIP